jgi:FemAB-related protein (PEP-CTERM system-associated)
MSVHLQNESHAVQTMGAVAAVARAGDPGRAVRGSVRVRELTPDRDASWDQYIQQSTTATVFHESSWLRAVQATYGHRPHLLVAQAADSEEIRGVLPLFRVSGPFTGRALISIPYAVYGGVVADDAEAEAALLAEARSCAADHGARYIELRREAQAEGFATTSNYYTFRTRMPKDAKDVLARYPRKSRAAIRQAIDKFGLRSEFGPQLLPVFNELYVRSLRRLGSPPHRRRFFERLLNGYGERCLVQVVYQEQEPVAGCLSLVYQKQILPYFAGIDDRYSRLNTSNYLYYALMQHSIGMGLEVFDFGRTRRDNEGGCSFKTNQGFEPEPLNYAFHSPSGALPPDLRPSNPKFSYAQAAWKRLPLWGVSLLGGMVTRWLP